MAYLQPIGDDPVAGIDKECRCTCATQNDTGWCLGVIACKNGGGLRSVRVYQGGVFQYDEIRASWCFQLFKCIDGKLQPRGLGNIDPDCTLAVHVTETYNTSCPGTKVIPNVKLLQSDPELNIVCAQFVYRGTCVIDPEKVTCYTIRPLYSCPGCAHFLDTHPSPPRVGKCTKKQCVSGKKRVDLDDPVLKHLLQKNSQQFASQDDPED